MHRAGFTLIELAIVLVIIGLIAGGVLVGQDLIYNAELRAQVRQIESYNTAVNTFKTKYNCLPGDCAQAVALGLGVLGGDGTNGNGNGVFDPGPAYIFASADGLESSNFWYHLSRSNLIEGSYPVGTRPAVHSPPIKMRTRNPREPNRLTGLWIASRVNPFDSGLSQTHVWFLTAYGALFNITGTIHPADAYRLDSKIDDGTPLGTMRPAPSCTSISCINLFCNCTPDLANTCVVNGAYNIANPSLAEENMCTLKSYVQF